MRKHFTLEPCDTCGKLTPSTDLFVIQTARQTMSSPAEYSHVCSRPGCAPFSDEHLDAMADDHADAVREGL